MQTHCVIIACHKIETRNTGTVHTSTKARLTSVAIQYPDPWFGSPSKFNRLFIGPLPTFPENFMQIRSEVFAQSCQQTDRQTDNDDYISSLAEVIRRSLTGVADSFEILWPLACDRWHIAGLIWVQLTASLYLEGSYHALMVLNLSRENVLLCKHSVIWQLG